MGKKEFRSPAEVKQFLLLLSFNARTRPNDDTVRNHLESPHDPLDPHVDVVRCRPQKLGWIGRKGRKMEAIESTNKNLSARALPYSPYNVLTSTVMDPMIALWCPSSVSSATCWICSSDLPRNCSHAASNISSFWPWILTWSRGIEILAIGNHKHCT